MSNLTLKSSLFPDRLDSAFSPRASDLCFLSSEPRRLISVLWSLISACQLSSAREVCPYFTGLLHRAAFDWVIAAFQFLIGCSLLCCLSTCGP